MDLEDCSIPKHSDKSLSSQRNAIWNQSLFKDFDNLHERLIKPEGYWPKPAYNQFSASKSGVWKYFCYINN